MKMTLNQLQSEVGRWAIYNFGANVTKQPTPNHIHPVLLEEVAPFLGLVEELGELAEAEDNVDPQNDIQMEIMRGKQKDAFGDFGIYMLDFTSRLGINIEDVNNTTPRIFHKHPYQCLLVGLGSLSHAVLKHHQGIRGMQVEDHFQTEIRKRIGDLLNVVKPLCSLMFSEDFWDVTEETWQKIVAKRNWIENKQDGGTMPFSDEVDSVVG